MSDLFDVSKDVILITGASQGLGRQFARVLSSHGAAVLLAALHDRQRGDGGRRVFAELTELNLAPLAGIRVRGILR
jgi:3-oxoacyl-[acyl-carrier protein] reductase